MKTLAYFSIPQLRKVHSGSVRESFQLDDNTRMIVSTDRISCFDKPRKSLIPGKGAILNALSCSWFEKTRHIIDNHFVKSIDPNIMIVKQASPIRVEMIVRGFLTGSAWRGYAKGQRCFSGIEVPDNMEKDAPFPKPIVTPTTKAIIDEEITPEGIVRSGLVESKGIYEQMEAASLELFAFGSELCSSKSLTLVDTKYEFGILDGKLILIDELHTPDSSRFWLEERLGEWMDKEFVRQWLLQNTEDPRNVDILPEEIIVEASRRYRHVFERLLGTPPAMTEGDVSSRIVDNLVREGLIEESM